MPLQPTSRQTRAAREVARDAGLWRKLVLDTGKGCSVCGNLPAVNVEGTYWLCGPCVNERLTVKDGAVHE